MMGDHGLFQKSVMYEGALRIPMIIADPRYAMRGTNDTLVELVDIYPTILEIAGVEQFPDALDGQSLIPSLAGDESCPKPYQISSLLHTRMISDGKYKLIQNDQDLSELYHLDNDPYELTNLIEQEAEIAGKLSFELERIWL